MSKIRQVGIAGIATGVLLVAAGTAEASKKPSVIVTPRTPRTTDLVGIRAMGLPAPGKGQHYRVKVWAHLGSNDDCSIFGIKDWLEPNGRALVMPDDGLLAGWCPGPASVTVYRVPNSSPKPYNGRAIVTKRFRIRR